MAIVKNQINMMGPKVLPTTLVPNCWKKNNKMRIAITIGTVGNSGYLIVIPSTAEEILMAGVMNPSAIKVQQPMMAG